MREKIEMKTHAGAVAATAGWPMLLAWVLLSVSLLATLPFALLWKPMLFLAAVLGLIFLGCFRMYLGRYLFLPATEIKGARIIARLGRNETEIAGVAAAEIIVKQGWIEKLFGACHIRVKGTGIYLRGVRDPEKVKAWVAANFPVKTVTMRAKEQSARKKKKK